ncbi:DNA glycosylase [Ceratocystis lukuohia]|uniref:DNA glycosylase n=1 Tax=Ceratocystis lukuohia TaxID=2019550 RepID=A0ABR4MCG5_9PEZI
MCSSGKGSKVKSKIKREITTPAKGKDGAQIPQSPFTSHPKPSPQDCHKVHGILTRQYGPSQAPNPIPPPSLTVAGCGEVPAVLDAVLRTVISGATTMVAANKAIVALVSRHGIAASGPHRGSVDWASVSRSTVEDLSGTIRMCGCATGKARDILAILNMAQISSSSDKQDCSEKHKSNACSKHNHKVGHEADSIVDNEQLSLEHIRTLPMPDAMHELLRLPRIGLKTAACVILFCLQRPCFAVDTHVLRMCRWLGWVPEKANAEAAFWHCETRVPQELKYPLHQLFIKHGQLCERCKAATVPGTTSWESCRCPLEELVLRKKKGKAAM